MVKRDRGPTNPNVASLIKELGKASKRNEAPIWRSLSKRLQKPRRNRSEVNLSKINRYSKANDLILVPGKVLGTGELDHAVTVAAVAFSEKARNKITEAQGRVLSIPSLVEENPKGSGVILIG